MEAEEYGYSSFDPPIFEQETGLRGSKKENIIIGDLNTRRVKKETKASRITEVAQLKDAIQVKDTTKKGRKRALPQVQAAQPKLGKTTSKKALKQASINISKTVAREQPIKDSQLSRGYRGPKKGDYQEAIKVYNDSLSTPPRKALRLSQRLTSRSVHTFEENISPARSPTKEIGSPLAHSTKLEVSGAEEPSLEQAVLRDAIHDDAERRLTYQYLQFLAYWDENCEVRRETTVDQHGSAQSEGFSGAHSALLPRVVDNHLALLKQDFVTNGLTKQIALKLGVLGVDPENIASLKDATSAKRASFFDNILTKMPESDQHSLLSDNTHLYHLTNSTIELPRYINEYHILIEDKLRPRALELLAEVSFSQKSPFEAIGVVYQELKEFLRKSYVETEKKIKFVQALQSNLELFKHRISQEDPTNSLKLISTQLHDIKKSIKELQGMKQYTLPVNLSYIESQLENFKSFDEMVARINKRPQMEKLKTFDQEKILSHWEEDDARISNLSTQFELSDELGLSLTNLKNTLEVNQILQKAAECPTEQGAFFGMVDNRGRPMRMSNADLLMKKWELISRQYHTQREVQ